MKELRLRLLSWYTYREELPPLPPDLERRLNRYLRALAELKEAEKAEVLRGEGKAA